MGEQIQQLLPGILEMARQQRAFLVRVVTYLAGEAGIRQFLDIGTGLPTANNTHEVAQGEPRRPGSSMSTTTRWSWSMPGPC
jgi:S-adenosyl methyltransferase